MPIEVSYPGVYIEQIPSSNTTITGVSTSICAFLGRALQGPVNQPMLIGGFSEFESFFGGLDADYPMSYTVSDFFANGGAQAVIVRLFNGDATPAAIDLGGAQGKSDGDKDGEHENNGDKQSGGLSLEASSPGSWGMSLQAGINVSGITTQVAAAYGLPKDELFNLTVQRKLPGNRTVTEQFRNVSLNEKAGSRRLDRVLENESQFVRVPQKDVIPKYSFSGPPSPTTTSVKAGTATDSKPLTETQYLGTGVPKTGINALKSAHFNLLCIPPDGTVQGGPGWNHNKAIYSPISAFCQEQGAFWIIDPPSEWADEVKQGNAAGILPTSLGLGDHGVNAAVYFPRVVMADPMMKGIPRVFPACGIIAGIMAQTDVSRGVWKAPAGTEAVLNGVLRLETHVNDFDNGLLNEQGINCLRTFPTYGSLVWGARTLQGATQLQSPFMYINVKRLTLYIEQSLQQGVKWAVFEPNGENLWKTLTAAVEGFMTPLQKQGAFYSFSVTCDASTTTARDIDLGIVNIKVAFAPSKPAEFVVIQIQQSTAKG